MATKLKQEKTKHISKWYFSNVVRVSGREDYLTKVDEIKV